MKYFTFVFLCFLFVACERISAGSYPYAERYEFNVNDSILINELTILKTSDSTLNIPKGLDLKDGHTNRSQDDHWYYIHFYDKVRDKIFLTWVREKDMTTSVLALVSIKEGSINGKWKGINQDYTKTQNSDEKEEFEKLIVDKIRYRLNLK